TRTQLIMSSWPPTPKIDNNFHEIARSLRYSQFFARLSLLRGWFSFHLARLRYQRQRLNLSRQTFRPPPRYRILSHPIATGLRNSAARFTPARFAFFTRAHVPHQ